MRGLLFFWACLVKTIVARLAGAVAVWWCSTPTKAARDCDLRVHTEIAPRRPHGGQPRFVCDNEYSWGEQKTSCFLYLYLWRVESNHHHQYHRYYHRRHHCCYWCSQQGVTHIVQRSTDSLSGVYCDDASLAGWIAQDVLIRLASLHHSLVGKRCRFFESRGFYKARRIYSARKTPCMSCVPVCDL